MLLSKGKNSQTYDRNNGSYYIINSWSGNWKVVHHLTCVVFTNLLPDDPDLCEEKHCDEEQSDPNTDQNVFDFWKKNNQLMSAAKTNQCKTCDRAEHQFGESQLMFRSPDTLVSKWISVQKRGKEGRCLISQLVFSVSWCHAPFCKWDCITSVCNLNPVYLGFIESRWLLQVRMKI